MSPSCRRAAWLLLVAATACDGSPSASGSTTGIHPRGNASSSSGGASCSSFDAGCSITQPCCAGLSCDPALEICYRPAMDAGPMSCGPSQIDGPCVTAADCVPGLACVGPDGGPDSCQAFSSLIGGYDCIGAGQPCGDSIVPCCAGTCANSLCTGEWAPCSLYLGAPCTVDSDCCTAGGGVGCINHGCQQFGFEYAGQPCTTDSDCNPTAGWICTPFGCHLPVDLPDGGTLLDAGPGCVSTSCEAADSGLPQCHLGSICNQPPGIDTGQASALLKDPCYAAGFFCETTNPATTVGFCATPQENSNCVVGGPVCGGIYGSTENSLACVATFTSSAQILNTCEQPCEKPSDCLDSFSTCQPLIDSRSVQETVCAWPYYYDDGGNFQWQTCGPIASVCEIPGQANGGTCILLTVLGGATIPLCFQGDPDAGVNAECIPSTYTSRQTHQLCAPGLFCNANGLCAVACDASGVGPPCDAGTCVQSNPSLGLQGLGFCQ